MTRGLDCFAMRLLLILAIALASRSVSADPFPDKTERVIGAGRVWAQVKFFHPWLGYKAIDWDAAFTTVLPRIEAAKTVDEYRAAIKLMVDKLGDPVTHVVTAPVVTTKPGATGDWLTTPAPGIVLADLDGFTAGGYDYVGYEKKGERLTGELAKAKVLVLDLRAAERDFVGTAIDEFKDALPAIERWPIERIVEHHGFWTQEGQTSGGYYSTYSYQGQQPAKPAPAKGPSHVVVIAERDTVIPSSILALQASGVATIVGRTLVEENAVTTAKIVVAGVEVQLRLSELLWGPPTADVVMPTGDLRAKALEIAKRVAGQKPAPRAPKQSVLPNYLPRYDADYAATPYPSRELRVLAGIRAWAILDRFWPYRYLAGDWDKALRETLPKLEAATDQKSYLNALRELGAKAGDGHINVWSTGKGTDAPMGTASLKLDLIEGKLAVIQTDTKGIAVGDVIETIGDKPASAVLAERRVMVSASTDEARDHLTAATLLAGPDGSSLKLGVRGADRTLREITVTRAMASWQFIYKAAAPAPHWKKLANNIGYVDLKELTVPEVEPMFQELGGTKAIVFDMRGYPKGTAWAIAPRLNVKGAKYGAQFLQPYVIPSPSGGDALDDQRIRFLQGIPPLAPGASIYRGKVIVLINSDAVSQSEHSCLFFQETAGATFIGSPTAGANGDVTIMRLPGGARMSFTGQEVKHVDGKQLQRVGIKPHIVIRPTLAGLRARKDELLDRALAFISTGK